MPNLMELQPHPGLRTVGRQDPNSDEPCKVDPDLELGVDLDGDGEMDIVQPVTMPGSYGSGESLQLLPAVRDSRTCPLHPPMSGGGAPFDGSPNWYSLD